MDDAQARAELSELIEDHLGRGQSRDLPFNMLVMSLARIGAAVADLHQRKGNWGQILDQLREGTKETRAAMSFGKTHGVPEPFLAFADRQVRLADVLASEVVRLQSGESTLA